MDFLKKKQTFKTLLINLLLSSLELGPKFVSFCGGEISGDDEKFLCKINDASDIVIDILGEFSGKEFIDEPPKPPPPIIGGGPPLEVETDKSRFGNRKSDFDIVRDSSSLFEKKKRKKSMTVVFFSMRRDHF